MIEILVNRDACLRSAGVSLEPSTAFSEHAATRSAIACLDLLHRAFGQDTPSGTSERPRRIGRYLIESCLGSGSFGIVYRAIDPHVGRMVAVKVLKPFFRANRERQIRFEREARATALLNHPGIVPVYDFEVGDSSACMVSACCDGGTLGEWIERQSSPVDVAVVARLLMHLALAVDHAHERGVVHRDLKPGNILLSGLRDPPGAEEATGLDHQVQAGVLPVPGSGGWVVARIGDFGLAKLADAVDELQTCTGTVLGTSAYMAPEQILAKTREIGPAADIYALGSIFYELLCGRPPSADTSRLKLICEGRDEPVRPIRQLRADVPSDLETICTRMLAFKPSQRYQSAGALAEDLRRYLECRPILSRRSHRWRRAFSWLQKVEAALVTAPVVVAVIGWGLYLGLAPAEVHERTDLIPGPLVDAPPGDHTGDPNPGVESLTGTRIPDAARAMREGQYVEEMSHASRDLLLGHRLQAARRLAKWLPKNVDDFDPRGPEWSYLWQQARVPEATSTWQQPGGAPSAACFSPDKRWVAVVDRGGLISIRDLARNEFALEKRSGTSSLQAVRFSSDSRLLAFGGAGGGVAVLDTETWDEVRRFSSDSSGITTLDFSPDGSLLAVGGEIDGARIWNWRSGEKVAEIPNKLTAVRWKPDGQSLIVGLAGSWMRQWVLPDKLSHIDTDAREISEFEISSDGMVATSFMDYTKYLMEDHRRQPRKRLLHKFDRKRVPHPIAISGNARIAAVGIFDGQVDVRRMGPDSLSCFEVLSMKAASEAVSMLAVDSDGERMLSATSAGEVRLWSTASLPIEPRLICRLEAPTCKAIAFSGDSRQLFCVGDNSSIFRFDLEHKAAFEQPGPAASRWADVLCAPDGNQLFSLDASGRAAMRLRSSGSLDDAVCLSSGPAVAIALSRDGRTLAIAESEPATGTTTVRLCTSDTGATLQIIPHSFLSAVERMEFSPDGRWLVVATEKQPLFLFSPPTSEGEILKELGQDRMKFAFCPKEPLLVTRAGNLRLNLWDLEQKTFTPIPGDDPAVRGGEEMAFSPDGRLLAVAGSRQVVHQHSGVNLMHFASRKTIAFLDSCGTPLARLHFSSDGRYLGMVGGHRHSVNRSSAVVWRLDRPLDGDQR